MLILLNNLLMPSEYFVGGSKRFVKTTQCSSKGSNDFVKTTKYDSNGSNWFVVTTKCDSKASKKFVRTPDIFVCVTNWFVFISQLAT